MTDCNTTSNPVAAGSRRNCKSARGAFDMVGNLSEWVADWLPLSNGCGAWDTTMSPTDDKQCLVGALTHNEPGALVRGGAFFFGESAGPLSVVSVAPSFRYGGIGFRCAR